MDMKTNMKIVLSFITMWHVCNSQCTKSTIADCQSAFRDFRQGNLIFLNITTERDITFVCKHTPDMINCLQNLRCTTETNRNEITGTRAQTDYLCSADGREAYVKYSKCINSDSNVRKYRACQSNYFSDVSKTGSPNRNYKICQLANFFNQCTKRTIESQCGSSAGNVFETMFIAGSSGYFQSINCEIETSTAGMSLHTVPVGLMLLLPIFLHTKM